MEQKEIARRDECCCMFCEPGDRDMKEFYIVRAGEIGTQQPLPMVRDSSVPRNNDPFPPSNPQMNLMEVKKYESANESKPK